MYNPYAAPAAPPPPPSGGNAVYMGTPQRWEIGEVLITAWGHFKQSWPLLFGSMLTVGALALVPAFVQGTLVGLKVVEPGTTAAVILQIVASLLQQVISAFFQIGMIRITLGILRNENPSYGTLFTGGPRFLTMFAALILTILAIAVASVFLIVPGIIVALGLTFALYFVADTNMGPLSAMRASWTVTNGHKLNIFLFGLVAGLLAFAGLLACCVGVFVVTPVITLATATIYLRITGRQALAYSPMQGQPPYGHPGAYPGYPGYPGQR